MRKKLRRAIESVLSVQKGREGSCKKCAQCCNLPVRCPMLNDKNECIIYAIRPLQCRKFPRCENDLKEVKDCGFYWKI